MAYQFKPKPETLAKNILQKRTVKVVSVVKKCLVDFSGKLLEQSLISDGMYDPDDRTRRQDESASVLYSACITAVSVDATNFEKVIHILAEYPLLSRDAQEMANEGVAAGLLQAGTAPSQERMASTQGGGTASGGAKLTIDDLDDVESALPNFTKWNKLGLKLGLSPTILEEIEDDHHRASKRLQEVLKQWLRKKYRNPDKRGDPTWNWLASAVEDTDRALAENIRKDHC